MAMSRKEHSMSYSYADYLRWPEDERYELINGMPFSMTPSPSRLHQEISMALSAAFYNVVKEQGCHVYTAPFDVRLNAASSAPDEDIQTVVQPDISVICDNAKLDERGCLGSPDLIVELVSPSTIKKDVKYKFHLYEQAGVHEYWIVYPENQTVMVFQRGQDEKYGRPDIYAETDTIVTTLCDELRIELAEIFS